ncbi:MAG TPA: hypothetical protein VF311_01275 [Terriglobales bacterium]
MTEADEVDRLLQILEAAGLGWVAIQVREHIRTGRTTMRSESVLSADVPIGHIDQPEDVDQLPPKGCA